MDDDFLADLDRRVSNVSLNKHWERRVGDIVIWFSPVDYSQQVWIKEVLREENPNALDETKRVTLACSIVGLGPPGDVLDLRPHRFVGKTLKVRSKDGKAELLSLHEFMHRKIAGWDSEFIDVAFDVFADIMASHRTDLVKEVKFENAKSPAEELRELEERVAELRLGAGMPPLVEAKPLPPDAEVPPDPEQEPDPEPDPGTPAAARAREYASADDFDPFEARQAPTQAPPAPPSLEDILPPVDQPVAQSFPVPAQSFPVPLPPRDQGEEVSPIERELSRRTGQPVRAGVVGTASRVRAHPAQPSVPAEVIERPAERRQVAPPKVDSKTEAQSRNPRFARPNR